MLGQFIAFVGGSAVLLGAITWLLATSTKYLIDKNLEKSRLGLQRDLENCKIELQKDFLKHQITYKRVDENVACALHKVYSSLLDFMVAVEEYTSYFERIDAPDRRERLVITSDKSRAFKSCLRENRLYLPSSIYDRMSAFCKKLIEICDAFSMNLRKERHLDNQAEAEHCMTALKAIQNDAVPVFNEIVSEFQARLGVTDSSSFVLPKP